MKVLSICLIALAATAIQAVSILKAPQCVATAFSGGFKEWETKFQDAFDKVADDSGASSTSVNDLKSEMEANVAKAVAKIPTSFMAPDLVKIYDSLREQLLGLSKSIETSMNDFAEKNSDSEQIFDTVKSSVGELNDFVAKVDSDVQACLE